MAEIGLNTPYDSKLTGTRAALSFIARYIRFNHCLFAAVFLLSGASFWLCYEFRFDFKVPQMFAAQRLLLLPYVAFLKVFVMFALRGHEVNWRYIGLADIPALILQSFICSIIIFLMPYARDWLWVPRGVILMDFFMSIMFIGGARVGVRVIREKTRKFMGQRELQTRKPCIIVGAGDAGEMVLREIMRDPQSGFLPLAFFDDDRSKWSLTIHGVKVVGPVDKIADYLDKNEVEVAIVAIPSATNTQMQRIYGLLNGLNLAAKTLPGITEMIDGSKLTQLRDVNISDLLGREEINIDTQQVMNMIAGKVALVTGAGGSIGSELSRQVLKREPAKLILMDRTENALFHIHRKLVETDSPDRIVPFLCDVCDSARVNYAFEKFKPDLVFHAAAHKHVPMQELNAIECFRNNVGGIRVLAKASHDHEVSSFLLVSTDKAVNPTSVMGASKRACELYCQAFGKVSRTKFLSVRFGNVLASQGSVVPIFMDQIANGGPVTVTHPEMRRYFMTIPEAVTLILQATALGESGQLMVLEMGEPIKILDLVHHLLMLMGKDRNSIPITFIGLRPGEKMFEEISFDSETYLSTAHSKIKIFNHCPNNSVDVISKIDLALNSVASHQNDDKIRSILKEIVPEYTGS